MSTNTPKKRSSTWDVVRSLVEAMRLKVIEAEAMARCAEERLERLPYIPRSQRDAASTEPDTRLEMGRLQVMVIGTAQATRTLLDDVDELLDRVNEAEDSGDSGNGGSSGNDSGGSGGGHGPSAAHAAGQLSPSLDRAELVLHAALPRHHASPHALSSTSTAQPVMAP